MKLGWDTHYNMETLCEWPLGFSLLQMIRIYVAKHNLHEVSGMLYIIDRIKMLVASAVVF
jgi:hypothetical protein